MIVDNYLVGYTMSKRKCNFLFDIFFLLLYSVARNVFLLIIRSTEGTERERKLFEG